jgi:hypothetical protein
MIKLTPNPTIGIPKPEFILYVDCRLSGGFDMAVVLEAASNENHSSRNRATTNRTRIEVCQMNRQTPDFHDPHELLCTVPYGVINSRYAKLDAVMRSAELAT